MNERIKELAEQAEEYAFDKLNKLQGPVEMSISRRVFEQSFREKFAELLIQECLKHAEEVEDLFIKLEQGSHDSHEKKLHAASAHGAYRVMDKLRQTFGVEE